MALTTTTRLSSPWSALAHVCEWCGKEAQLQCGNRVCGARYCNRECQTNDWRNGHRDVCKATLKWVQLPRTDADDVGAPLDLDVSQAQINGLFSKLLGRDDPASQKKDNNDGGLFSRLAGRYKVDSEHDTVVSKVLATVKRGDDDGDGTIDNDKDEAAEPKLLTDVNNLKQLRSNARTAKESGDAEDLWKETKGGAVTSILGEMREITRAAKNRDLDVVKPLAKIGRADSSFALAKRFMAKIAIAGFKVTFAGGKVAAGTVAATATVVGIPLDTLIDAIAIVLDVLLFASTVLESMYGLIRGFVEIKDNLAGLLTFAGGPPGVQANVDNLFGVLQSLGLEKRAKQFMGSIGELFGRFIQWGAPVIGSVIGLAIPYDASITGRVIEYFLYPIKWFITKGWLLIRKIWDLLHESWQQVIQDKEKWNEMLAAFIDLIKRLFPDEGESWKTRLIDKSTRMGINLSRVHPLVVVGVLKHDRLDQSLSNAADLSKRGVQYTDKLINGWIDDLVIPNIDKITTVVQAALGMGFGFIYMLYAYTPSGIRKKLGISAVTPTTTAAAIGAHMSQDADVWRRFVGDTDQRLHEIRQIMCQVPTEDGSAYIMLCVMAGVPVDLEAPNMNVPAVDRLNWDLHRRWLADQ